MWLHQCAQGLLMTMDAISPAQAVRDLCQPQVYRVENGGAPALAQQGKHATSSAFSSRGPPTTGLHIQAG